MSRKRYEELEDYCVDEEGNQIILVNESNSPTSEPEVSEDNVEYDYVYENGQTYTNSRIPIQYQFIDTESNDIEHNSSGSKNIKAASGSVKISGRIRPNTSQTYTNSKVPIHYQFIDAESNDVEHNSSGSKNIKAASGSVKISDRITNTSQTYTNSRVPIHYQFIDAESNDVEHNSSGSKNIKAASGSVKISDRMTSNTSQTYSNNRVPMHYQFIDAESNVVEHNSSGCKNIKAASSSVKIGKITSNTTDLKEEEMKLLLKKYVEFARNVGKDKKFKDKKEMWAAITEEMNNTFHVARTQTQYMTKFLHRFQTQNKRRKVGESFQSEIDTLNSLHEDIMNDFDSARLNELEIHGEEITGPDSLMYQILPRTIIEVAKIKAHAQERRHREYIECVNKFEAQYMENITKIINNI